MAVIAMSEAYYLDPVIRFGICLLRLKPVRNATRRKIRQVPYYHTCFTLGEATFFFGHLRFKRASGSINLV